MIFKSLTLFLISVLMIGCNFQSKSSSDTSNPYNTDNRIVKSHRIDTIFQGPNETELRALLVLYVDSMDVQIDSLILTDCSIHDRKIPYHFLTDDKLVFEDCNDYPGQIKALRLDDLKQLLQTSGFVKIAGNDARPQAIDKDNEIMIYFSSEIDVHDIYFVNSLDLSSLEITRLDTVFTIGDPLEGYPVIKQIDSERREAIINYIGKNYATNNDIVNY